MMVFRCRLQNPDSELDYMEKVQCEYAVDLVRLQEELGLSFYEARFVLSYMRGENTRELSKEFGMPSDNDSIFNLGWDLDEKTMSFEYLNGVHRQVDTHVFLDNKERYF